MKPEDREAAEDRGSGRDDEGHPGSAEPRPGRTGGGRGGAGARPGEEEEKRFVGERAAFMVRSGMKVGLGTGSTASFFLQALGRRVRSGELRDVVGVSTSVSTEEAARELGIPVMALEDAGTLDLTVDGADEVDPELNLIKGLGGALLREKMVAQASRRFLIIVDEGKVVVRLGTRAPLPVELVPFSWRSHLPFLASLGGKGILRLTEEGEAFRTDNGNFILDVRFDGGIPRPDALEEALGRRAGIVETGLFLGMAGEVLVGGRGGIRTLKGKVV